MATISGTHITVELGGDSHIPISWLVNRQKIDLSNAYLRFQVLPLLELELHPTSDPGTWLIWLTEEHARQIGTKPRKWQLIRRFPGGIDLPVIRGTIVGEGFLL
jgi:hypothetical protein